MSIFTRGLVVACQDFGDVNGAASMAARHEDSVDVGHATHIAHCHDLSPRGVQVPALRRPISVLISEFQTRRPAEATALLGLSSSTSSPPSRLSRSVRGWRSTLSSLSRWQHA